MSLTNIDYESVKRIIGRGRTISSMESCTGGLLASVITDCSGASEIYPGGFVTYSNMAKNEAGVPEEIIEEFGVYSAETAEEMARVCASAYDTDIGIGVTGSLGRKDPANPDSRVGEVYVSIFMDDEFTTYAIKIPDDLTERPEMKKYIVNDILDKLNQLTS